MEDKSLSEVESNINAHLSETSDSVTAAQVERFAAGGSDGGSDAGME